MKIGEELRKKLSKTYESSSMIEMEFKGNDLSFKTDAEGNPVLLFIGKREAYKKPGNQKTGNGNQDLW